MKILTFISSGLHGYIDKRITFNSDVTYLTGINGTGKTSVLRSIIGLLQPSAIYFLQTEFNLLSVTLLHEGKNLSITAIKDDKELTLFLIRPDLLENYFPEIVEKLPQGAMRQVEEIKKIVDALPPDDKYKIQLLMQESFESPVHFRERWSDFILEQDANAANHPLTQYLRAIPTPMFLGLERGFDSQAMEGTPRRTTTAARRLRGPFTGSLRQSIRDASELLEDAYRDALASQKRLADQLRDNIILASFGRSKSERKWPDSNYVSQLRLKGERVKTTLLAIGLDNTMTTKHLTPFFEELEAAGKKLVKFTDLSEAFDNEKTRDDAINWMMLAPQEERAEVIYRLVEAFNKSNEKVFSEIKKYQNLVNSFFQDGHKILEFTPTGTVIVRLPNQSARSLSALSSGESHILVILTQLFFNQKRDLARILIIDEPELSLHIKWQELFVRAVQSASDDLQIILATHSPSIFLDNIDMCVDLS